MLSYYPDSMTPEDIEEYEEIRRGEEYDGEEYDGEEYQDDYPDGDSEYSEIDYDPYSGCDVFEYPEEY